MSSQCSGNVVYISYSTKFRLPLSQSLSISVFFLLGKGFFLRPTSSSTPFVNVENQWICQRTLIRWLAVSDCLNVSMLNTRLVVVVVCFCGYRGPKKGRYAWVIANCCVYFNFQEGGWSIKPWNFERQWQRSKHIPAAGPQFFPRSRGYSMTGTTSRRSVHPAHLGVPLVTAVNEWKKKHLQGLRLCWAFTFQLASLPSLPWLQDWRDRRPIGKPGSWTIDLVGADRAVCDAKQSTVSNGNK